MDARPQAEDVHDRVTSILGQDGLALARAPLDALSGLPNEAYWSNEWLDLENERLFRRSWVFAGAQGELAEAGAIKPMQIGGTPIVLVRGADECVRAFHNVCRHRGTQLVDAPCTAASITCPYHAWTYRLDGRLKSRAHFAGPGQIERFDHQSDPRLDLHPVRCETWNGCIFVDISGTAEPLLDWLAPMLARTKAYDFSTIRWIGARPYTVRSNWKLVLENYMEGYHVFAAHPRLIAHAPMSVRWSGEWIDSVFYNDYVAPKATEGRGEGLPHYPGLEGDDTRRGLWFACLPNFAVEVYADQFVVLASYPVAPDRTEEVLHFFVVGDAAASEDRYGEARAELMQMWHDLNLEDVEILERLQNGRRSIAFDGSNMSPAWEVPAHQLAGRIVDAILAD